MKTPGERFHYWITKVVGESVVSMAELIGVEHRTLYNVIRNNNKYIIGRKTLVLLKVKFPMFPWDWIREGKGEVPGKESAERRLPEADSESECMECRAKDKEISKLKDILINSLIDNKALSNDLMKCRDNKFIKHRGS